MIANATAIATTVPRLALKLNTHTYTHITVEHIQNKVGIKSVSHSPCLVNVNDLWWQRGSLKMLRGVLEFRFLMCC